MPGMLKADNLRVHCQRTITKGIPQDSPTPSRGAARLTAARALAHTPVLGTVCERSTNRKPGAKTWDLQLKSDGACGPSANCGKRESEESSGADMRERKAEAHKTQLNPQGAMLTLTWCGLTLP